MYWTRVTTCHAHIRGLYHRYTTDEYYDETAPVPCEQYFIKGTECYQLMCSSCIATNWQRPKRWTSMGGHSVLGVSYVWYAVVIPYITDMVNTNIFVDSIHVLIVLLYFYITPYKCHKTCWLEYCMYFIVLLLYNIAQKWKKKLYVTTQH